MLPTFVSPKPVQAATWTAKWIWDSTHVYNQWASFRKTVTLSSAPTSAITQIAADTKYWLYVNGNLVVFEGGLKRGPNPSDSYYDEIDLKNYLTAGTNTIAVLVWYYGKTGFSYNDSGDAAFMFQSNIVAGTTTTVNSDASWKVKPHPGYSTDLSGGQPNYRLPESNIYYNAQNATSMSNWMNSGYNDSSWVAATEKGTVGVSPWGNLVKRPIPFFKYTGLMPYTNATPSYGTGTTPIKMNLPSNLQVTPYLQVNAPAGAVIGIQTDHYADGGNGTDFNVRSTYITTGGIQEFESLGWMSGTAVEYTIPSNVQILGLKYRESGYNTNFVGSFQSDDTFFNTLWNKSARTMYLNMRDNYMDTPTRERAQWWGDVVNEMKQGFYVFDTNSYALGKKAISELVNWQKPTGELYAPIPSKGFNNELPPQMLASIWTFWQYYMYTGDASAINSTYNSIKTYMNLWTIDANGLINHRPGDWDWEDWGSDIDARVLDNSLYYLALDTTIKLANLTGNTGDVAFWQGKKNSISNNFNNILWNTTNQEYRSPGYTGDTDDRANAMAVVAGLADTSKYAAITNVLNVHKNASPYMEFYVLEALYKMGSVDSALARMKDRYAGQVSDPGYTLFEFWTKGGWGTDNHGWNGGPLYVLSAYASGVRPTQPGYTSYQITPQMGSLKTIQSTVPTIKGNIIVSLTHDKPSHFAMNVTSPGGTTASIAIPKFGMNNNTITANGTTVYSGGAPTGSISGLTYLSADNNYVYFQISPGTWSFNETGTSWPNNDELPAGFTYCGTEGATCTFSGTATVAFGAGKYNFLNKTTSTACNAATFGDPASGLLKSCYVAPSGGPSGYTLCAAENGLCSFSGPSMVAFGANGAFSYKIANNGTACNVATFGNDPLPSLTKNCYLAPSGAPTSDWTQCATEAGTCTVTGTQNVLYGAKGAFASLVTGTTTCDNVAFGSDPISGVAKACYVRTGAPTGYSTLCAVENGTCSFTGPRTVAFGAADNYTYRTFYNGTACNVAAFGNDPILYSGKSCYITP
ncbi:Bacterial alpha-L-rhamnosidase [Paenibacillus sp. LMG 31461]|uniref:Bacterial alpha-L-rhamnosidase n=2 Tax=Paenibacillus plantarum TaxID=2654975 RepID=A0ABX1X3I7_9BACL|nr:Bacterial alpha-L-rhamnosidase [Paenibacillus plantarum]